MTVVNFASEDVKRALRAIANKSNRLRMLLRDAMEQVATDPGFYQALDS